MVETAEFVQLVVPDKDAQFYFHRLINLNEAEVCLNKAELPIKYWGEVSIEGEANGIPGLRWGLHHAIFGSFVMLDKLGYGMEARAILTFYREGNHG